MLAIVVLVVPNDYKELPVTMNADVFGVVPFPLSMHQVLLLLMLVLIDVDEVLVDGVGIDTDVAFAIAVVVECPVVVSGKT